MAERAHIEEGGLRRRADHIKAEERGVAVSLRTARKLGRNARAATEAPIGACFEAPWNVVLMQDPMC